MIHSMTGFGAAAVERGTWQLSVSVKTLNHRFLDLACHTNRRLAPVEAAIRDRVQARLSRGRVEVFLQGAWDAEGELTVIVSRGLARSLAQSLGELKAELDLGGSVTVADVARFPGVVEVAETAPTLDEGAERRILEALDRALDGVVTMRAAEGERLAAELVARLEAIEAAAAAIEAASQASREARRETLTARLRLLLQDFALDDSRLYQEVVRAVERHDIAEEVQRLRSHATMSRQLVSDGRAPAGKRLDFLAQELMREANTMGSKAADVAVVQAIVGLKADIERFREQVQNVE